MVTFTDRTSQPEHLPYGLFARLRLESWYSCHFNCLVGESDEHTVYCPYGTERSYNGMRLARALARQEGQTVRVFLMGDAVICAKSGQKVPAGYYNAGDMLHMIGAEIGLCGTCMEARGLTDDQLISGARRSTLKELAEWTVAADKVLVF